MSKATIYNRFGGRDGLVDAVIEHLVADKFAEITHSVEQIEDPVHRLRVYLLATWWSAYYEPVVADVLAIPDPTAVRQQQIRAEILARADELLADAQAAGGVRDDLTAEDVHYLI